MRTLWGGTVRHSPSRCPVGALQTPQSPRREHESDQATFPCSSHPTQPLLLGAGCQYWSCVAGKFSQTVVQTWLHSDAAILQTLLLEGPQASCQAQTLPSQRNLLQEMYWKTHFSQGEDSTELKSSGKKKTKSEAQCFLNSQEAITTLQV